MSKRLGAHAGPIGRETWFRVEPESVLVLTRKSQQTIVIGDDIEVTVCSVSGDKVRIGIQAPPGVSVHREEVYLKIHQGEHSPAHVGTPRARTSTGH